MAIRFGAIIRGRGCFFLSLDAEVPEGGCLSVSAATTKGSAVPAFVTLLGETDGGEGRLSYAVVIPELRVGVHAHLSVLDSEGRITEEAERTVARTPSVLESKGRYLLGHTGGLRTIRETGVRPIVHSLSKPPTRISFDDVLDLEDGKHMVKGRVWISSNARCEPDVVPEIHLIGCSGADLALSDTVIVDDVLATGGAGSEAWVREISYHILLGELDDMMIVWASFGSATVPDAFEPINRWEAEGIARSSFCFDHSPQGAGYGQWFSIHQQVTGIELMRQVHERFPLEPRFSFIVPLYNTPTHCFREMVDSVFAQSYGNFELLLVNASPEDETLMREIERACARDARVREVRLEGNEGITLNTNAGIREARGEFLCFLDHDDVIEPNLLFEYVRAINDDPTIDLLYCDEDKYEDGRLVAGNLKPDFDWATMDSLNLVTHLMTVRRSLVDALDELPGSEMDGAQDYCLALLVAEKARSIRHVPLSLYHWRIHPGSTSGDPEAKAWAFDAGARALQAHYDRMGVPAKVSRDTIPGYYLSDFQVPADLSVSVVIVAEHDAKHAAACVRAALKAWHPNDFEIVVVGHAVRKWESLFPQSNMLRLLDLPDAMTTSEAYRYAVEAASYSYIAFLDERVEALNESWIRKLIGPFWFEGVCAVSGCSIYADGTVSDAGVSMIGGRPARVAENLLLRGDNPPDFKQHRAQRSAVLPNCLMVHREEFLLDDGLDIRLIGDIAWIEWSLRNVGKGRHIVYEPAAVATLGNAPIRSAAERDAERRCMNCLLSDYASVEFRDPYFSPWFEPGTGHGRLKKAVTIPLLQKG